MKDLVYFSLLELCASFTCPFGSKGQRESLWHGRWFLWLFLCKCTHGSALRNLFADGQTCYNWKLIFPVMMMWVLLPLASTRVLSAELSSEPVPSWVAWDTLAQHGRGVGPGTWDSGFKDASRKEKMRIRLLGGRSLVQMARWLLTLWRKKEALGQEEKQDIGDRMDESLMLNPAIIRMPWRGYLEQRLNKVKRIKWVFVKRPSKDTPWAVQSLVQATPKMDNSHEFLRWI